MRGIVRSALVLLVPAIACQSYIPPNAGPAGAPTMAATTPTATSAAVEVKASAFEPDTTLLGPAHRYTGGTFRFRTWLGAKYPAPMHQLYVTNSYRGDWKFWRRANGQNANELELVEISSDVISCRYGCSYAEAFGITLSDSLLQANRTNGYAVKVYAKSGDELVLTIPSPLIDAQLARVAELRKQK